MSKVGREGCGFRKGEKVGGLMEVDGDGFAAKRRG